VRLETLGLRQSAVLLWNANNLFGFEAIDWPVLDFVASITTVRSNHALNAGSSNPGNMRRASVASSCVTA